MTSLETARLHLRIFRNEDLDDFAKMLADPAVMKYVSNGLPISREESDVALKSTVRHWREHGFGRWATFDRATNKFVGFGGLRSLMGVPEVVYHLAKEYWGRGLATELANASLQFGFETHSFDRVVAVAKPENAASIHVMEKIGMTYEMHTSYYDIEVIQYQIARDQFQSQPGRYELHPDAD
jgi:ribosomal-protein-alanine N-acetyltransferase